MKRDEAERVLEIMVLADGGCTYCARELFNQFIKEFPDFGDLAKEIFEKRLGDELEKD
jgi:hypothetical protein